MKTRLTQKLAACVFALLFGVMPTMTMAGPPDLAQLKEAADRGDRDAQKQMGDSYCRNGYYKNAEHYYRLAAEAGHLDAAYALGGLLAKDFYSFKGNEQSMKANPQEAFQWYWRLAAQGYGGAQRIVARHYLNGTYVSKDRIDAYKWFRVSSIKYEQSAQFKNSVTTAGVVSSLVGISLPKPTADYELDQLILVMTKEEIAEGERRAVEFRPGPDPGPRIIGLKLNGFIGSDTKRLAIINGKPLSIGESVALPMAGTKRLVTLKAMTKDSVIVTAEGIAQPAELSLAH